MSTITIAFFCTWATGNIIFSVDARPNTILERTYDGVTFHIPIPGKPAPIMTEVVVDGVSYPAACRMAVQ